MGETEWATEGETNERRWNFFFMKVNRRSHEGFIACPVGISPSSFLKAGNESIKVVGKYKARLSTKSY